jgi:hypothetical protein
LYTFTYKKNKLLAIGGCLGSPKVFGGVRVVHCCSLLGGVVLFLLCYVFFYRIRYLFKF